MKKTLISIYLVIVIVSISLLLIPQKTYAYQFGTGESAVEISPDTYYGEGDEGVDTLVETIFNAIITVSEIIFIVLFLIGGVMYLTSMGNEEQSSKARKLLLEAIVGLVIVLAAWAVGTWLLNRLKENSQSGTGTGGGGTNTEETITPGGVPNPTSTK